MRTLRDVTVLDVTQVISGPYASMLLGDLGAEVLKIERPGSGSLTRGSAPMLAGVSAYFAAANRNKRYVTLNLQSEDGQEVFRKLATNADVLVENLKAGTMDRYGLGYDAIREVNPEIIYCSISGYGEEGPYADQPAFDPTVQAMGGAMSVTGESDGKPLRSGIAIGDLSASMYATQSIIAALYGRDTQGAGGQYIEVPMLDCMISWLVNRATYSFATGEPYPRNGSRHADFAPWEVFETADSYLAVVSSEALWPTFCESIDRPDLIDDERFETNAKRVENQDELYDILDSVFVERTSEEWFDRMREHGAPAAPIYDTTEVWEDEHVRSRDLLHTYTHDGEEGKLVKHPVRFSDADTDIRRPPREVGAETDEVLAEYGFSATEIEQLRAEDTI